MNWLLVEEKYPRFYKEFKPWYDDIEKDVKDGKAEPSTDGIRIKVFLLQNGYKPRITFINELRKYEKYGKANESRSND
jgi:hypothetical protein